MKISELIKELEKLKKKHGDVIVTSTDEEGVYEITEAYQSTYNVYSGTGTHESYNNQLAVRLC